MFTVLTVGGAAVVSRIVNKRPDIEVLRKKEAELKALIEVKPLCGFRRLFRASA